jgi:chemotaxis signal transduction protein
MSTHFVATKPPQDRPDGEKPDATETAATTAAARTPSAPVGSSTAVLLPAAASRRATPTRPPTPPPVTASDDAATHDRAPTDRTAIDAAPPEDEAEIRRPDGYVVFAVGDACFAVPVDEVRAVIRTERLDLLPGGERPRYGRGVALVDVRGRAIPVVDLRSDPSVAGEVLLPLYRHHVGLVVDRVVSVSSSRELVPEPDGLPDVLPAYAHGVLRPAEGGLAVLLVGLPDAEFLQS